ncbi:hypothetical protein [Pseudomonas zeae]|uniref:hypothetical protein n=1 Tax=Pseudomonas zeae TaxID=2745510 RepID=UPI0039E1D047
MNNKQFPIQSYDKASLEFLTHYDAIQTPTQHTARFLESEFDEDCWRLKLGRNRLLVLDFRIELNNRLTLAQCDKGELVRLFKLWICSVDPVSEQKGFASTSTLKHVYTTIKLIDYILLNWQALEIEKHGLRLFNGNDLKTFVAHFATTTHSTTSIYQWPRRLLAFIQDLVERSSEEVVALALEQFAFLNDPPPEWDESDQDPIDLDLMELGGWTPEYIIRLRAVLWHHGFYRRVASTDFRWGLNTDAIATIIYAKRILGAIKCPAPKILSLICIERRVRECPAAPTRHRHDLPSVLRVGDYLNTWQRLNTLAEHSPSAPIIPLTEVNRTCLAAQFNFAKSGRYICAPVEAILGGLRHSIEFYISYGEPIISSYLTLAKAAHSAGKTVREFCAERSIVEYLSPALRNLHVEKWCLKTSHDKFSLHRMSRADFFVGYRRAPGLWELLRILYGAIGLVLGALEARRASELETAMADTCLTADLQSLVTRNRKTGLWGLNQSITRPIPAILSRMLTSLIGLQTELIAAGILKGYREVLSYPTVFGRLRKLSHVAMIQSIDFFCDYFETPKDDRGRRYYFRHHQLRRFFAQIFFWHQHTDSLDVLRWMLGHADSEMIYHYISDTTPGEVLRQVKSEWGSDMLRNGAPQAQGLRDFLQERWGISDFTLLSEETLDNYIMHALKHKEVTIEPHFIHDEEGTTYRIMVTVHEQPRP